jgi:hypothetical protein
MREGWEAAEELPAEEYLSLNTALPLARHADLIEERLPTWPVAFTG